MPVDLDRFSYVLDDHKAGDDPPTWHYQMPTVDDVRAARKHATDTDDDGKESVDTERFSIALVARSLRRVDNLRRQGEPVRFPADGDLEERCAFVRRLPFSWLGELGGAVQSEGDLDAEEERVAAEVRGGDSNGSPRDVRLQEVSPVRPD